MPAKKNQSMRSKSTTSYKKGGSIKNQKVHPLKYFNDQREKKIIKAQAGIETYDKYDTKMNPMDSKANAALAKAKKEKENNEWKIGGKKRSEWDKNIMKRETMKGKKKKDFTKKMRKK
jgi:hypothetical protein